MRDEWMRLQAEFHDIHLRPTIDPPFASFQGMIDPASGDGYIGIQVSAGFDRYSADKLRNLCEQAGRLLPESAWDGTLRGRRLPRHSPHTPELARWITFVASCNEGRIDLLEWVDNGNGRLSFTGRLLGLAAACDLAIDKAIALPTGAAAPESGEQKLAFEEPEYLGGGIIRIAGDKLKLEVREWCVLEALLELGAASKSQLASKSLCDDAPTILGNIQKKYPALAGQIIKPGSKGKGGYRTKIKDARPATPK